MRLLSVVVIFGMFTLLWLNLMSKHAKIWCFQHRSFSSVYLILFSGFSHYRGDKAKLTANSGISCRGFARIEVQRCWD